MFEISSFFQLFHDKFRKLDKKNKNSSTYFLVVVSDLIVSFETLCCTLKKRI